VGTCRKGRLDPTLIEPLAATPQPLPQNEIVSSLDRESEIQSFTALEDLRA